MWRNRSTELFDDMWSSLRSMQRGLDTMFRQLPAEARTERSLTTGEGEWENLPFWNGYPLVDVWHEGEALHVRAEVPGMKPEDIDVTVQNNELVIRGRKTYEKSTEERNWLMREVGHGHFERRFRLPEHIDVGRIEAKYDNGVLDLTMPATEKARPRKIEVRGEKKKIHAA